MSDETFRMLFGGDADETTTAEQSDADDAAAEQQRTAAAQAEAQERALTAEVDRYIELLPAIERAKPLPPLSDQPKVESLTGAAWLADRLGKVLAEVAPANTSITSGMSDDGASVAATVQPPAGVKGLPIAQDMLAAIEAAGNLGMFEIERAGGNAFTIRRDGISGATDPWNRHGVKAGRFHDDRESRKAAWDAAGLSVPGSEKGMRKRPKIHAFGEDERGGTVELELPDGITTTRVQKAVASLRQSLNAPALEVTERGVHPVLHLNTKTIAADFPKVNPMPPTLFVRPRTQAERHVAAESFALPLGVRADGSPILIDQADVPHMAVFGGTGSGKTVLLTSIIDAALVQSAEVILVDGKAGKDLRRLAFSGRNGIVHYAAGSEAVLHRAVKYVSDEFARRKALQERLQRDGKEYRPPVLLLVFDEYGSWIHDLVSAKGERAAAALETVTRMEFLAAQARELKIFLLLSGQHSYVSAMTGTLRDNIKTLVVIGPPSKRHLEALFEGPKRQQAKDLGAAINPKTKGRGLLADTSGDGDMKISMFQGFFNPPGPDADAMTAAVSAAPRLRRFAYRFPLPDEEGGDGSWQSWTPVTEPSSDSLPVKIIDLPDGRPDPAAVIFDPTSTSYSPGSKPLSTVHINAN